MKVPRCREEVAPDPDSVSWSRGILLERMGCVPRWGMQTGWSRLALRDGEGRQVLT